MKQKSYNIFIIYFALFVILQMLTGTFMFFYKIGYKPSMWYEYYYGSEEMLKYYPLEKDNFKEPLTFEGRLKVLYSHTLAYGILIFSLTHLIRSLILNLDSRKYINILILLLFSIAFLEIFLDLILTIITSYRFFILYMRFIVFIIFVVLILIHAILLIYFAFQQNNDLYKDDHINDINVSGHS